MIPYELAKQLKDAGFPQKGKGETLTTVPPGQPANEDYEVYCPTLSELIEACGDRFGSLVRHANGNWRASEASHTDTHFILKKFADATTPDVAVALLWLELNKK